MQLLIIQFDNGVKRLINCLHYADHIGRLFTNCNLTPFKLMH